MTFAIGHVQGGTNAGHRIVRPTSQPWTCKHGHENQRFRVNCSGEECKERRP